MSRLRREVEGCRACGLWRGRNKPVVGEGSLSAKVMFIGEAPGRQEDSVGKPFVGRSGRIFDELLDSVGLRRGDVYITNVVKCRPPSNRNPTTGEVTACRGFLDRQIAFIQPETIVSLGNYALSYVFEKFNLKQDRIGRVHGRVFSINSLSGIRRIIPLYHPACVAYNPGMREVLLTDFRRLAE